MLASQCSSTPQIILSVLSFSHNRKINVVDLTQPFENSNRTIEHNEDAISTFLKNLEIEASSSWRIKYVEELIIAQIISGSRKNISFVVLLHHEKQEIYVFVLKYLLETELKMVQSNLERWLTSAPNFKSNNYNIEIPIFSDNYWSA